MVKLTGTPVNTTCADLGSVLQSEADLLGPSIHERGGPTDGFLHQKLV